MGLRCVGTFVLNLQDVSTITTKPYMFAFSRCQSLSRACADHLGFVLCDCCQDVDCEPVGLREITGDELNL
jgi:hypothetical protein